MKTNQSFSAFNPFLFSVFWMIFQIDTNTWKSDPAVPHCFRSFYQNHPYVIHVFCELIVIMPGQLYKKGDKMKLRKKTETKKKKE